MPPSPALSADRPLEPAPRQRSEPAAPGLDLEAAFRAHVGGLLRLAERLTGAGSHVEDIVQEAFVVALRRHEDLTAVDDLRAWLYRVTANVCRAHSRSRRRRTRFLGRLAQDRQRREADADRQLEHRDDARRLLDCLDKLPHEQREVFVLFELEELQGREISELLGIPEGTAWTRLRHARKRVRSLWARRTRRTAP